MLHVAPEGRCTLTDLLKGKGKGGRLLCGCGQNHDHTLTNGNASGETLNGNIVNGHEHYCVDHDFSPDEEDDGDEWLKGIKACSAPDVVPDHVHIKVPIEAKAKRRFF